MNIFLKNKIKKNPNIIDTIILKKNLTEEDIEFAMNQEYKLNADTIKYFINYPSYINKFINDEVFLQIIKDNCINGNIEQQQQLIDKIFEIDRETFKIIIEKILKEEKGLEIIENNINLFQHDSLDIIYNCITENFSIEQLDKSLLNNSTRRIIRTKYANKNLESFLQLLKMRICPVSDSEEIKKHIENSILENPSTYLKQLEEIEELVIVSTDYKITKLYSKEFIEKIKVFALENDYLFDESLPSFILKDQNYIFEILYKNPKILEQYPTINIELDIELLDKIANKIKEDKIIFDDKIPKTYTDYFKIFREIIYNNPALIKNNEYLYVLDKNVTPKELIDFLINNNYKLEENIPDFLFSCSIKDKFEKIYLILQHDINLSKNINNSLIDDGTREQHKQIYELFISNGGNINLVNNNKLFQNNPYIILYCLKNGYSMEKIDFENVAFYDDIYRELEFYARKNGIDIPKPKENNSKFKFNEKNDLIFELKSSEDIKEVTRLLKENGLEDINIYVILDFKDYDPNHIVGKERHPEPPELIIKDNLEILKDLKNISFGYKSKSKIINNWYSLNDVIEAENFLEYCVQDIKNSNFSPLEKYIAIYDIVKNFKPYNLEKNDDSSISRGIYQILNNDYICCVGYANLLNNLCSRVGIPCIVLSVLSKKEENANQKTNHAVNYVHISDEKYGVDGFYIAEPTWAKGITLDKEIEENYYYMLMTTKKGRRQYDYCEDDDFTLRDDNELQSALNDYSIYQQLERKLKRLDPIFYEDFKKMSTYKKEDVEKINKYLHKKINKSVSETTLLNAIMNVKRKKFKYMTEEQLQDLKIYYILNNPLFASACQEEFNEYTTRRKKELLTKNFEQIKNEESRLNTDLLIESIIQDLTYEQIEGATYFLPNEKEGVKFCIEQDYNEELFNQIYQQKEIFEINQVQYEIQEPKHLTSANITLKFPKIETTPNMTLVEYINKINEQKEQFKKIISNVIETNHKLN